MTETAAIVVRDERGVAARLPDASIWRGGVIFKTTQDLCCSLGLQVADGVHVSLARKRKGDLLIQLNWSDRALSGARLVDREGRITSLESGDVLHVPLTRPTTPASQEGIPDTVLLGFRGELRVGDDVAAFAERTLLSGTVKIIERAPGSGERYVNSEATLDPGDAVIWQGPHANVPVVVAGFVHVGSGEGLQVVAHAAADYVLVQRFGAPPYQINPSRWERVTREPLLNGLAALILSIAALATLADLIVRLSDEPSTK